MVMVVDMRVVIFSTCLATLSTCALVVDGSAVGKDNNEEKIREVAVVRMYHFGWNFLQLGIGCDMLWRWWLSQRFLHFQHV